MKISEWNETVSISQHQTNQNIQYMNMQIRIEHIQLNTFNSNQTPWGKAALCDWTFHRGVKSSHRCTSDRVCMFVCVCVEYHTWSWLIAAVLESWRLSCALCWWPAVTQSKADTACFLSLVFTLCVLLRFDNIAVHYITPAHGVYHSERHFMLYNHSIYITFSIKS